MRGSLDLPDKFKWQVDRVSRFYTIDARHQRQTDGQNEHGTGRLGYRRCSLLYILSVNLSDVMCHVV